MKLPLFICVGMFGAILALQGYVLHTVVDLQIESRELRTRIATLEHRL